MRYVYMIQSLTHPNQKYVGQTEEICSRFAEHNRGKSPHTSKYRPWKMVTYVAFNDKKRAIEFEHYLKSGSGRTFASRHLW